MKNLSLGTGLAILGFGIAIHPLTVGTTSNAFASAVSKNEVEPTITWFGVTSDFNSGWTYHRQWSDGRLETRFVNIRSATVGICNGADIVFYEPECAMNDWTEVPPAPGGEGFACRADINGDRLVDGADLAFVLSEWGQTGGCSQTFKN